MSSILFAFGLALVAVTAPAAVELLIVTAGLLLPRRKPGPPRRRVNSVKIVVPAHNEEALVGRCVKSLLAQDGPGDCEVIVVADNCTDATARAAGDAGARVLVRNNPNERGKGFALRFAFDRIWNEAFDAVLVVDADSVVSANLVRHTVELLGQGAEAVQHRYRVLDPGKSMRRRLQDLALLAFNVLRPMGRDRWGLSAGILGNGFALSRRCLERIPYTASSVVEDLEYHLLLVDAGIRVRFGSDATVYGEMPAGGKAAQSQRSRWEGGRLRMAREFAPALLQKVMRGRLRLAEPLMELLTLPLAYFVIALLLLLPSPSPLIREYGAACFVLLAIHVLTAAGLSENFRLYCQTLACAPFYVAWKLAIVPATIRDSRRKSSWVRTERDAPGVSR